MKLDVRTMVSPAARRKQAQREKQAALEDPVDRFKKSRLPRLKAKAITKPDGTDYEPYMPAKHNPTLPRRPGSEVAFTLPSIISGERVYPRSN